MVLLLLWVGCVPDGGRTKPRVKPADTDGPAASEAPDCAACPQADKVAPHPVQVVAELDLRRHVNGNVHMLDIFVEPGGDVAVVANKDAIYTLGLAGEAAGLLDALPLPDLARLESLEDGRVVLSGRNTGLHLVDVSEPSALTLQTSQPLPDAAGMAHTADHLFVATHTGDLVVFSTDELTEVGRIGGLGNPWEIVALGERLYVADNTLGLVPVDVSDPVAPVLGDPVPTAGSAQDLDTDGAFVYVAVGAAGIEIFSLDDPERPARVASLAPSGSTLSVSVADGLLWSTNHEGVFVASVDDPRAPFGLSGMLTDGFAMHVAAYGDQAVVADWYQALILSVDRDARAPRLAPDQRALYLPPGTTTRTLEVLNEGAAPLDLHCACIPDARFTLEAPDVVLPGTRGAVTVTFQDDGAPVDTSLYLSTNDPARPVLDLPVASTSDTGSSLAVGEPAIDFVLDDLDGNSHRLSDALGHPVVLAYFATW